MVVAYLYHCLALRAKLRLVLVGGLHTQHLHGALLSAVSTFALQVFTVKAKTLAFRASICGRQHHAVGK